MTRQEFRDLLIKIDWELWFQKNKKDGMDR